MGDPDQEKPREAAQVQRPGRPPRRAAASSCTPKPQPKRKEKSTKNLPSRSSEEAKAAIRSAGADGGRGRRAGSRDRGG
jgi:hypothetical protein